MNKTHEIVHIVDTDEWRIRSDGEWQTDDLGSREAAEQLEPGAPVIHEAAVKFEAELEMKGG